MVTDEQLKKLAENYILTKYAPPGLTGYIYEDGETIEYARPDEYALSSWAIDTTIECVSVEERDDEAREYIVVVDALVTIAENQEEGEDESQEAQSRNISVYITSDSSGELYVVNADE